MTPAQTMTLAGVPESLHAEAIASLNAADFKRAGLTLKKWRARLFLAGKIASLLNWTDERLCLAHPEMADDDIAPVDNITCNGDMIPWAPDGSRPLRSYWLSQDPGSDDYKAAVFANRKYCPGQHPRSRASRKAWYRRNAGEYMAWRLGAAIDPAKGFEIWRGRDGKNTAIAWRCCGAWIVKSSKHLIGSLYLNSRKGYEIDNVFSGDYTAQMWWPIAGYELRAPVTWSVLPGGAQSLQPKRWERPAPLTTGGAYTHWVPNA